MNRRIKKIFDENPQKSRETEDGMRGMAKGAGMSHYPFKVPVIFRSLVDDERKPRREENDLLACRGETRVISWHRLGGGGGEFVRVGVGGVFFI